MKWQWARSISIREDKWRQKIINEGMVRELKSGKTADEIWGDNIRKTTGPRNRVQSYSSPRYDEISTCNRLYIRITQNNCSNSGLDMNLGGKIN